MVSTNRRFAFNEMPSSGDTPRVLAQTNINPSAANVMTKFGQAFNAH